MIHAYDEYNLNRVKINIANMFDCGINTMGYNPNTFADYFVISGFAKLVEQGNPSVILGRSGIELAQDVIYKIYNELYLVRMIQTKEKSPEYWAGWALADFQWYSGYRFRDIFEKVSMEEIIAMYPVFHEMDIQQFRDEINRRMNNIVIETKLKRIREARGLSQAKLAEKSQVQLRSIQMYEQRNNQIDKAQVRTVYLLARALNCEIEDLLENPMN